MSIDPLLVNSVVVEKRTKSTNAVNEEIETYADGPTITANVQDRDPTELKLPDFDGPVIVNAVVFTTYADGLGIVHLDILRQTDGTQPRRYKVIFAKDPGGRHHHWEMQCERLLTTSVTISAGVAAGAGTASGVGS